MAEVGWVFVEGLKRTNTSRVFMTYQHLAYGADQYCRTVLGFNLRQKPLQQGEHLKKRCKLWAPTWHKEMGWAPEAG